MSLKAAKARLDQLDLYPTTVRIEGVRVVVWPWFFRWFFPQFDGMALTSRTIVLRDTSSEDLLTHELCHVWQSQQDGRLRTTWAYIRHKYEENPYEIEARAAVASTESCVNRCGSTII